jgi:hypothetical protein
MLERPTYRRHLALVITIFVMLKEHLQSDDRMEREKKLQVVVTHGLQHFLDSQLIDGSGAVSLTCQMPFTLRKIPGTRLFKGSLHHWAIVWLEVLCQLDNPVTS